MLHDETTLVPASVHNKSPKHHHGKRKESHELIKEESEKNAYTDEELKQNEADKKDLEILMNDGYQDESSYDEESANVEWRAEVDERLR